MFFDRLRVIAGSLRFRLMLWNAGAVALTGVIILFAVREGVRRTLVRELDEVLNEDLREIELFLQSPRYSWIALTEELNRKAQGHEFHRWFVQFYDREGQESWASLHTPLLPEFTTEQRQQRAFSIHSSSPADAGTGGLSTSSSRPSGIDQSYRVSYRELPAAVPEAAAVCVGCSQRYLARDMATIDRQVLLVGLALLSISPLVGHLLTNRTIRPLAQMIRTTARLRPGELAQRVPVRGTGDELDSLARTINGLLDRIATYLQEEHDFLANAAHDLRTPVAAIRSTVEVALGAERTQEEYQELLGVIIEQCSALQILINQLLLLAESDTDRLRIDPEPVRLDQVIRQSCEMFEGIAEHHGVELRVGSLPVALVAGNRHHLSQVVNNLLDNALKFTAVRATRNCETAASPTPAFVQVNLTCDESHSTVRLEVVDTGIGIEPEHLPHVFDRFYRADRARSRDATTAGSGLGLAICKAFVEAHRGVILVQSNAVDGTVFRVTLPTIHSPLSPTSQRR